MQTHYTSFGEVRDTPSSLLQKLLSIFNGTLRASACAEHQMMQGAKYVMLCPPPTGNWRAESSICTTPGVHPPFLLWLRISGMLSYLLSCWPTDEGWNRYQEPLEAFSETWGSKTSWQGFIYSWDASQILVPSFSAVPTVRKALERAHTTSVSQPSLVQTTCMLMLIINFTIYTHFQRSHIRNGFYLHWQFFHPKTELS